jgi:Ca2+/Na+ antiporter
LFGARLYPPRSRSPTAIPTAALLYPQPHCYTHSPTAIPTAPLPYPQPHCYTHSPTAIPAAALTLTLWPTLAGVCDLIANLVIARNGYPGIAIAAVYGGPVLNVFIGMGVSMLVGISAHGGDTDYYKVPASTIVIVGAATLAASLLLVFVYVFVHGKISPRVGYALQSLYAAFIVASVTIELVGF